MQLFPGTRYLKNRTLISVRPASGIITQYLKCPQ